MPKAKAAPNFNTQLEEMGDGLSEEEKAAAAAEERGDQVAAPEGEETPAEAAPQTAEQPEAETGGKGKAPKVIPYDRFQEVVADRNQTRTRLEQVERESADLREKWARLDTLKQISNEAQNRAAQAQAAAERAAQRPDPEIDPQGARLWDTEQALAATRQETQQLRDFVNTRSTELQGWTQQQQMAGYVQQAANRGRLQHPDWDARVDFARAERAKFWMSVGHNEEAAKRIVTNEEMALVTSAAQTGADLVAAVANMTVQWGYKSPTNGTVRTANGNVKLDQIANGQKVQGLGRTQSAESPAQMPWQTMDDQQFAQHIVGMDDSEYLEMTKNKDFNKRVASLDTR